jgi:hypothetical protein
MARTIEYEINIDTNLKSVEDLKKELGRLEAEFETVAVGSKEFKTLGNQIKGVRSELKDIDLQFEGLDKEQRATALVDTFNGLSGAVGAVSSAFIAFGANSENIENAEKKLLGVIGVVSGLRDVSNGLVAANKLIGPSFSALGESIKVAFTSGTKAAQALKLSLASLGIGALIILIDQLIKNWDKVTAALGFATDEQKKYNDALIEAEAGQQQLIFELNAYNEVVQDTTKSEEERAVALQALNDLGVETEDITLSNAEALDELNERIEKQTQLIVARARAEAAASLLQEALEAQLKAESSSLEENIGFWEKLGNQILYGNSVYGQSVVAAANSATAAKNQGKAVSEAQEEVDRATKVYQQTLDALLPLEAENSATQTQVKEALERRAKAEKGLEKALQDRANLEKQAQAEVAKITQELEVLRAEESEKEIVRIKQSYADRLELLKQVYGEESEEVKNLLTLQNAEINEVRKTQEVESAQELADLKKEIADASAVTLQEQQALELSNTEMYYDGLIAAAQQAGLETEELEQAKLDRLKQLNDSYRAEEEAAQQEDVEKERAYRQQLVDLALNSGLGLISALQDLNRIYDQDSEEAAKKAFNRQKALSIAETIISTYLSAQQAYQSQFLPIPSPDSPIRGAIAAGVAVAGGLARVAVISQQKFNGGGGTGGAGAAAAGGGGGAGASGITTAPSQGTPTGGLFGQTTQPPIAFPTGGQDSSQPLRAYVLVGDVTNGQEAEAKINNIRKL